MATTITSGNATNGATISSDNTGILELKTGTGAGTTAITADTSQNVGIGTSSPGTKLSVLTNNADVEIRASTITSGDVRVGFDATGAYYNWIQTQRSSGVMQFAVANTERLRIGLSGQLGIGGANYGTSGQVLTSGGSGAAPSWVTPVTPTADVQTFNGSGTWTKPATGTFVRIQMWGGGGGGNRSNAAGDAGAGGGGGYFETTVPIASMGATAAVTVGGGGTGRTGSTGAGTAGGNSGVTLGSGTTIYVSGGAAVGSASTGGSGGWGLLVFNTTAVADTTTSPLGPRIGEGAGCSNATPGYSYTGGGGGRNSTSGGAGGWGGGGGSSGAAAGGTSAFGGAGGNASIAATQPGGGGGASASANVNGNNGAAGRVIITTY
jgi:hypothetical protein